MKGFYFRVVKVVLLLLVAQASVAQVQQTDLSLSISPASNPVVLPADGSSQTLTYTVSNDANGMDVNGVNVEFSFATDISQSFVTSQNSNWSCTALVQEINCGFTGIFNAGDSSTLNFNFNSPVNPVLVNNAIYAIVSFNGTDTNFNNDDINRDIDFVAAGPSADLSLTMNADQFFYTTGDLITLDLTVNNPTASTGTPVNTAVITTLSNKMQFNSAQVTNATGWSCTHDGSPSGGEVTCLSLGNPIAIGSNRQIQVTAVADSDFYAQGVTVSAVVTSDFDNNTNNNTASVNFDIDPGTADLSIQMNSTAAVYNVGDSISYVVQVENPVVSTASPSDVTVVIDLPNEVSFNTVNVGNAPGWICAHDGSSTGGRVDCNRGGAAFNSASIHSIAVDVLAQSPSTNAVLEATISSVVDTVLTNNTTSQTDVINQGSSDFSLYKTVSGSSFNVGDTFTYVLTVASSTSSTISPTDVLIKDPLPNQMSYDSYQVSSHLGTAVNCTHDGSATGGLFRCTTSSPFQIGETVTIDLNVTAASASNSVTNSATVETATDADGASNNNNNSANSITINVMPEVNITAVKTAEVAGVQVSEINYGQTFQYLLEVQNSGDTDAQNVVVTDSLPSDVSWLSSQASGWTCSNTGAISCALDDDLSSGATAQILIDVVATSNTSVDSISNTMEVTADNFGTDVSSVTVNLIGVQVSEADLALELNQNNQQIQQGGVVELSFTARNAGPSAATNAKISGGLTGLIEGVQLLDTGGWMCQVNNSSLVCQFPGDFQVGMQSEIRLSIQTQQVVAQSQAIVFNATIESNEMDSQPANNMISFTNEVSRTPTEDEIFAIFQNAVGSGASETVLQTIRNVSSYCARRYFMAIEGLCGEFIAGATPENGGAIINAMEEITPNEVAAQSNSAAEIITSQFNNVSSRLAQLRGGGGGGFNLVGLNARYGDQSIPLGMLAYLNQPEDQQVASNINNYVSPWGLFINGSISMGERDATGKELGFDFDTYGLTAGVDYRFSATKVAGIALGYANFDSAIEGEAEMKSTSLTLTGYGSLYLKDSFYIDGRVSYGHPDFKQKRRINFVVDDIVIDRVATGETESDQYSVAISAGYHFNKKAWNITPNVSAHYIRTTIDAFQESGAGGFNFAFGEQEVKSLVWSLGASVSRAISLKNGIISPQFDFNLKRETENDGGLLAARFISAPDDEIFWIGTDEPDRTYGSAGIGLVFVGANGKQAYINYRSIFGLQGFSRGTLNVGVRFEF